MTTFSDLQNEVLLQLEGFVNDHAAIAKVSAGISASDTTIVLTGGAYSDGSGLSTGIWEIEEELVYVPDFNRSTYTATNVVRGYRGSTAATHSTGATVRNNPRFPVIQVKRAVNDAIRAMFPRVPAVKTADLTTRPSKVRYQLPANARAIISVALQDVTDDYAWLDLPTWKFVPTPGGDNDGFTAIELVCSYRHSTVRVVYAAAPSALSANADVFETVSGLPDFTREAVVWGAMWRLYSMVELGRGAFSSADQTMMNQSSDFGKATDIAKYLLGMYQQAVTDCESRMQDLYPARKHYVW